MKKKILTQEEQDRLMHLAMKHSNTGDHTKKVLPKTEEQKQDEVDTLIHYLNQRKSGKKNS